MSEKINLENLFREMDSITGQNQDRKADFIKAPFAWAGGKTKSLGKLLVEIPLGQKYIEVFGGSGVHLINREPVALEVFNDRYSGVFEFYRCLKDNNLYKELCEELEHSCYSRQEFHYCRDRWGEEKDIAKRAAMWYYMIRCSFGSVGRAFGTVIKPTSNHPQRFFNSLANFEPVHNRLRNTIIENLDWEECMKQYDSPDAIFYCDPPYLGTEISQYKCDFMEEDHKTLCRVIFDCDGYVALSGYANSIYDSFDWDDVLSWRVRVTVGGGCTKYADECLYIKYGG